MTENFNKRKTTDDKIINYTLKKIENVDITQIYRVSLKMQQKCYTDSWGLNMTIQLNLPPTVDDFGDTECSVGFKFFINIYFFIIDVLSQYSVMKGFVE